MRLPSPPASSGCKDLCVSTPQASPPAVCSQLNSACPDRAATALGVRTSCFSYAAETCSWIEAALRLRFPELAKCLAHTESGSSF